MATHIINELDQQLASLNQLKPPGASKGKIGSITQLCVSNIQAESNIVQSLYRAVKKAPSTHKLGAIYAIDSVVRRWIETAKQQGQDLNIEGRGEPGTYPAAVKRVTELMPALFDDIVKVIPAEQREKLESMIKIWEKGNTFPIKLLEEFRTKVKSAASPSQASNQSNGSVGTGTDMSQKFFAPIPTRPLHTPVGNPPQHLYDQGFIAKKPTDDEPQGHQAPLGIGGALPTAPGQDVNSILSALANAVPKSVPQQTPVPPPTVQQNAQSQLPANLMSLFGQQNGNQIMSAPINQAAPFQQSNNQASAPMQFPQGFPGFPPQPPPSVPQQYAPVAPPPPLPQAAPRPQEELLAPLLHILPANILNDQGKLIKALELLQDLQKEGIPPEHWGPVLKAFEEQYQAPAQPNYGVNREQDRSRDRSRSPDRHRRGSPVYGTYDENAARRQDNDQSRGGGRNRFRQRSPLRDSPEPANGGGTAMNGLPMQPKYIALDSSLPPDHIKVLSRTLFVGGAVGTQQEIHDLFSRFGKVQTCIANREKRHAFVKMTTRSHALEAKANLERLQSGHDREVMNIARQTKWGVGFGPRECCDYARGESIIPVTKLTEADVKWLLTAEYGGTGGQQIEGGMVLEEPDIEIGAGVSSKAMSKRVTVDSGGPQAPAKRQREESGAGGHGRGRDRKRNHGQGGQQHGQGDGGYGGYGGSAGGNGQQSMPVQMEAYGYARPEPVAVATPPAVPGFGFSLPGSGQGAYR